MPKLQPLPGAAHDRDRARGPPARDPDPHAQDALHGRVRRRRALDLQGRRVRKRTSAVAAQDGRDATVADGGRRTPTTATAGAATSPSPPGCGTCSTGSRSSRTRSEFMETLKIDLFEDEVFVFTPKGEVKSLAGGLDAARLRLRGPHRRRPPLRGREGERQDHAAALPPPVGRHRRDPHLQAGARALARLALAGEDHARAQQDPRLVHPRAREDAEHRGRELLQETLRKQGLPAQKITGSPLLADVIREMGFRKADDFYVALGQAKISTARRRQQAAPAPQAGRGGRRRAARRGPRARQGGARPPARHGLALRHPGRGHRRRDGAAGEVLPARAGRRDRRLHLARSRDHDPPRELQERRRR